jgi:hypothetical protein
MDQTMVVCNIEFAFPNPNSLLGHKEFDGGPRFLNKIAFRDECIARKFGTSITAKIRKYDTARAAAFILPREHSKL